MTIDERLDRLTERHEALTQSVELLYVASQQHEATQRKTDATIDRIATEVSRQQGIADQNGLLMAQLLEVTMNLGRQMANHEARLREMEGKLDRGTSREA